MNSDDNRNMDEVECFPIRTVAAMTGVSAVTLRAWERRYGLVVPGRSDSGHRLYTNADVRLIQRVVELLERGVAVGQVASLLSRGLSEEQVLTLAGQPLAPAQAPDPEAAGEATSWHRYRDDMMAAIAGFDEARLNQIYNEVLSLYPLELVNQQLVLPTLRTLGEQWSQRAAGIAEEHFFTVYLRSKLGARVHHLAVNAGGPMLVAACMPGERHDLGLLMFALAASNHGYRVVMLGACVPARSLGPAASAVNARAVVLSTSMQPAAQTVRELAAMAKVLQVPLVAGGVIGPASARALQAIGISCVGRSFNAALHAIDDLIGGVPGAGAA